MSLILDALKRAERERNLGHPPEAGQVATISPMAQPAQSRDRLSTVLGILLIAASIIIVILILRDQFAKRAAAPSIAPVAAVPAPAAPAAVARPNEAPAIAGNAEVNNLDDVAPTADSSDQNAQAEQLAEAANAAEENVPPPPPARMTTAPSRFDRSSTGGPHLVEVPPSRRRNAAPDPSEAGPAIDATPLRKMPEEYRSNFPALDIDVHVYHDEPERRFIIVGGDTYHEGASLPQGPRIASIVPDGIVFEWEGQRVLYPLGSN